MRLPKRALGVPLHPLLVHFPIALWFAVPVLDAVARFKAQQPWWALALWVTAVGLVIGALAIITGLLDYIEPSVVGIDMRLAARHAVRTSLAWCAFLSKLILAGVLSPIAPWSITACLALDLLGCGLLLQGIYFGTKQVYEQLEKL